MEYSDSKETIAEKISSSNLIYLTGGLVSALTERLTNMGVDRLLRNYDGVIVGRSAGALALCRICITTCRSNSKVKIVNGVSLVDLTLKVHYKPEKDNALKLFSKQQKIYAVPEGAALVYANGQVSVVNNVYLFLNGERQILSEV